MKARQRQERSADLSIDFSCHSLCPRCLRVEAGFTLIELMVVILILGFAGSIVYPRLSGSLAERERLRASVNQLAAVASYGRDQAAATNRPLVLTLDLVHGAYSLADASAVETGLSGGAGIHVALAEGVTFRGVRLPGRPDEPGQIVRLRFTPEGWADPAVIELAGADGAIHSVVITAPTGRVETFSSAVSGDE